MKALTISQPFATMIVSGEKWIENRSWYTDYRGPLAIHAGQGTQYLSRSQLQGYPTGAIIGTCKLAACVMRTKVERMACGTQSLSPLPSSRRTWREAFEHRHCEGPWCWILEDVREVEPFEIRGAQRLWIVPDSVVLREVST